jgi:hypothetical protein
VRFLIYFYCGLVLFLSSCAKKGDLGSSEIDFFHLEEFTQKQISDLGTETHFSKTIIDEMGEYQRLETNPDWGRELDIWMDFELNKTANIGEYQKDSTALRTRYFFDGENSKLKVKWQEIYYSDEGNMIQILSQKKDENPLFKSRVDLTINLDDSGKLIDYVLEFDKKVILMDQKTYKVITKVVKQ